MFSFFEYIRNLKKNITLNSQTEIKSKDFFIETFVESADVFSRDTCQSQRPP